MFPQFVFFKQKTAYEIKLFDLRVFSKRHNGAGNEVRRAKITAHRVEGDLHQSETLRAKTIDCKAKFVTASLRSVAGAYVTHRTTATVTCLPTSGPGGHGNSRTMGRRCATARCSRTVGIC